MVSSPPQPKPQRSVLNLPEGLSPESIDTLPVLSAILSRLQTLSPTTGTPAEASPSHHTGGTALLSIKDIPAATDDLKHRLQKARAQVKELPDIDRTLADQEEEISELQEKIRKQKEVLRGLREVGLAAKKEREERDKRGADGGC